MDPKTKTWIDKASYEELLRKWRFGACKDPLFIGEDGVYYFKAMFAKQNKLADLGEKISQKIGFVNPDLPPEVVEKPKKPRAKKEEPVVVEPVKKTARAKKEPAPVPVIEKPKRGKK